MFSVHSPSGRSQLLLPLLPLGGGGVSSIPSEHFPHDGGAVWVGGKGLFWSQFPSPGRRCSPLLPRRPSRALLQPKQGRSSNRLWVGSSGRSRVLLSRLPLLIIPRELVGVVSPPPALQAPSPATRVPRCTMLPIPCRGPCPKPPRAVTLGSSIHSSPEGAGVGRAWARVQTPSKRGQNVAPLQGVNV